MKKFKKFLEKNDAYDAYVKNLKKSNKYGIIERLITEEDGLIGCAFAWEDTSQEYEYWSTLDIKWRLKLEKSDVKKAFIIEKFRAFLEENDAYDSYVKNVKKFYSKDKIIELFLGSNKDLIVKAFSWFNTEQGAFYWDDLHYMWLKTLKKIKK